MSFLNNLFGGGSSDSADAAYGRGRKALEHYGGVAAGIYSPWMHAGFDEFGNYRNAVHGMEGPNAFMHEAMEGYEKSPQYYMQQKAGQDAIDNASAASGMLCSGQTAKRLTNFSQQNTNADIENYLNRYMQMHNQYLNGLNNLSNMGFNAAQGEANAYMGTESGIAGMYGQQGNTDFRGQLEGNAGIGALMGMGGNIIGGLLG